MSDISQMAYLNGQYLPLSEARISPMDRGFLFGDGIYEVIPSYGGRLVGMRAHMQRMRNGLDAIGIRVTIEDQEMQEIATRLLQASGNGNLGVYFHISRGADLTRMHGFPEQITPTIFAFAFAIPEAGTGHPDSAKCVNVVTCEDMRWRRCHIKSTSLLGNVLHFQHGREQGQDETILYNQHGHITEASACNVFAVLDNRIVTPALDNQLLPGITRQLVISILRDFDVPVVEDTVTRQQLREADEVWLTSSSKEIRPVVSIDGQPIGSGKPGRYWHKAMTLYAQHKFDY
ncbi:aminotransferase class IV [Aestuariibacter salexigens]|uniref:aminotransferase class IV n=1 Tax=Aestuariibacter salexigens TaxID=226010 RepID=UPI00040544AC|nr:aminotransferase class IV [Aestuariibacter salexigens]